MKKVISVVLILVFLFSLCACTNSSSGDSPATPSGDSTATASDPASSASESSVQAPESITIGVSGELGRFLAGIAPAESMTGCDAVFDSIFRTDPETKQIFSDILESWEWTDDTTFVMKMKQNVMFSNGDNATAEDLIFSYSNHPERGSNYLNNFGILFDQCVATDEYTATFKLEKPYGAFTDTIIYLVDKSWCEEVGWDSQEWYNPVGSGPYKCTDYVADDHMTLQARDDYWNEDAGPIAVKEWIIKNYPDPSTMFMDLEVGTIQMCEVQSADYSRFVKDGGDGINCLLMPTGVNVYFMYGYKNNPIWEDQKLREAIACGVNWEEMGKLALGDMYVPAKSLAPEKSPEFINAGVPEFDQEKAKQLLTEAGYSAGELKLQTFMMDTPLYKNFCESFQFYAQEIGIDVSIEYGDISTAIAKWVDPAGGIDFGWNYYLPGSPSYSLYLSLWTAADENGITWCYVDDDEFQALYENLVYSTDQALQLSSAQELQQIAFDRTLLVPVAENALSVGYRTDVLSEAQVSNYFSGSGNYQISRLGLASVWN